MGRVSTCQKNCNTIDLRRAQVKNNSLNNISDICLYLGNKPKSSIELLAIAKISMEKYLDQSNGDMRVILNPTRAGPICIQTWSSLCLQMSWYIMVLGY